VANRHEETLDGERAFDAGFRIFDPKSADGILGNTFDGEGHGIPDHFDLFMGGCAVSHDLGGAEGVAAVDEVDFAAEPREEEGLFGGAVASADDGDVHFAVESTVAGGAGGDTFAAKEFFLAGDAGHPRRSTGGDNDGLGEDGFTAADEFVRGAAEIDLGDEGGLKAGAEAGGLLAQVVHHHEAIDTLGKAGEVFHFGRGGELAARLAPFEDKGIEIGAGSVDGGGKTSASSANDDDVFNRFTHGKLLPRASKGVGDKCGC